MTTHEHFTADGHVIVGRKHEASPSRYKNGCRHPDCREAHRVREAQRRLEVDHHKMVDSLGTKRRLLALRVAGHDTIALGRLLGRSDRQVSQISRGFHPKVMRDFAERVRHLYDSIVLIDGGSHPRHRREAVALGGHHPDHWRGLDMDDPAASPLSVPTDRIIPMYDSTATATALPRAVHRDRLPQPRRSPRETNVGGSEMGYGTSLEGSTAIPPEYVRPAALVVAAHSRDADDARALLGVLGLLGVAA